MKGPFCMKSNGALPSIPHPNREQALKMARLTAGFPNIVNGQRIDSSRRIKLSGIGDQAELKRLGIPVVQLRSAHTPNQQDQSRKLVFRPIKASTEAIRRVVLSLRHHRRRLAIPHATLRLLRTPSDHRHRLHPESHDSFRSARYCSGH